MAFEGPTVAILLLGDPDCGKSTFLARLAKGQNGIASTCEPLTLLRDLDQPFVYDIRMYNRPYRFEFYDTASPTDYTLLRPDFVILCYDVTNRGSLEGVKSNWRKRVILDFRDSEERLPVMLLGLKRDLRTGSGEAEVDPQEGYRVATETKCDRYAECSAVTEELMHEVFEDIARLAVKTTTVNGAKSEGPSCRLM